MDTYFKSLPIELTTIITSYLSHRDTTEIESVVNVDYNQLLLINFKDYYNSDIINYNLKTIYKDLLLFFENWSKYLIKFKLSQPIQSKMNPNASWVRCEIPDLSKFLMTDYINKEVSLFYDSKQTDQPFLYNSDSIIYLMLNKYISINTDFIGAQDDVKLFVDSFKINRIIDYKWVLINNSLNILTYMLDNKNIFKWIDPPTDIISAIGTYDVDFEIFQVIFKNILFTSDDLLKIYRNLGNSNIYIIKYVLESIKDVNIDILLKLLIVISKYGHSKKFILLYNKFKNILSNDQILSLYNSIFDNIGVENENIKGIIIFMSNLEPIKDKYLYTIEDVENE